MFGIYQVLNYLNVLKNKDMGKVDLANAILKLVGT